MQENPTEQPKPALATATFSGTAHPDQDPYLKALRAMQADPDPLAPTDFDGMDLACDDPSEERKRQRDLGCY